MNECILLVLLLPPLGQAYFTYKLGGCQEKAGNLI